MELDKKDLVWNRAALDSGGSNPGPGDSALAALLLAHGLIMNGGVEHALEVLSPRELEVAVAGYRYFSLYEVSDLLTQVSKRGFVDNSEAVDRRYWDLIPHDDVIVERFEEVFASAPESFSPLCR